MASGITGVWRSFWHTMTSNDRHASPDMPYRTGAHTPLAQSRHAPLTSVATAAESRTDLDNPYAQDNDFMPADGRMSPNGPYSPGLRSTMQRQSSSGNLEGVGQGEIQMQSFSEGLPPPPPVGHSWRRIDSWAENNHEELFENLCEGCTQNDVNELEHELDCTLPMEMRESLMIHDGQERGGRPTGILFGCMLLDCEEIVQEWKQWARVGDDYLRASSAPYAAPQVPNKAFAGSSTQPSAAPQSASGAGWRSELMAKQDSHPPNAVQKAYVHPGWIPVARDWGGNNICIDLAPGPAGKWGQVILAGRDYDCKYVVARSWSAFLAAVADDFSTPKAVVDEDSGELTLREFKNQNVDPSYMDILRWRTDQKYGRRAPKGARPQQPLRINSNVKNEFSSLNGFSPYASPTGSDRGRSPQRFSSNGKAPANQSPRGHVSSPLARVAEEAAPTPLRTDNLDAVLDTSKSNDNLLSMDSPLPPTVDTFAEQDRKDEKEKEKADSAITSTEEPTKGGVSTVDNEEMKTVEI
ncbi:putative 1,3-beta-glucan biosynthesis protein [Aureobasidium subglaciale]|nr:putative 1,3-beta-glucan biosynthesis protein [Aureobasidium subglaciale]KAI5220069.1 putative 1,3-beta-glucan biosynthesis protein [Aureobasidium subglaciale]KAI5224035.1 putative 1,3-beta-glucan biosynthesis protein [Aureobasidium subglaciale]KAI5260642.1 putative 1,3-beta-glucan biosynthesis protein [Aureobasidium subglaciale]